MGWDDRPPRGFTNPLEVAEEKEKVKKGTGAKAPAVEKVAGAAATG
jgi:hypothetical protein